MGRIPRLRNPIKFLWSEFWRLLRCSPSIRRAEWNLRKYVTKDKYGQRVWKAGNCLSDAAIRRNTIRETMEGPLRWVYYWDPAYEYKIKDLRRVTDAEYFDRIHLSSEQALDTLAERLYGNHQ